ncbi:uncharacterized protein BO80DRAFT_48213 [Aspergillus ibericus CBS 121593]|uniref:Uncharacterized protein n=1 Tax=Aspergillus ibericus CBS 121593 TaxID=1448316 RepID=A0A395H432_9EURO|nr:hypothetical protein BO80DRAFT_48213 [Aspergillus ibericus CBS 121593]RAL01965.1 hypothetical protein BO80DRAFT_48213 [Aspergillus ibericus CBS 121593]
MLERLLLLSVVCGPEKSSWGGKGQSGLGVTTQNLREGGTSHGQGHGSCYARSGDEGILGLGGEMQEHIHTWIWTGNGCDPTPT